MKKFTLSLVAVSAGFVSVVALANDTSFPEIQVEAIDTNASVGSYISFSGAEALELLKVLPRVSTTGGPQMENHRRALIVRSPGYEVSIFCRDYEYVDNKIVFGTKPKCSIQFGEKNMDRDGFPFKAESVCTLK